MNESKQNKCYQCKDPLVKNY